jgi:hypothetical protein
MSMSVGVSRGRARREEGSLLGHVEHGRWLGRNETQLKVNLPPLTSFCAFHAPRPTSSRYVYRHIAGP